MTIFLASTQIWWLKMVNTISMFDHGEYTLEFLHWQYASFLDTQSRSAEWMHFIWTNYNFKADGMATSFEVLHFNLDNYIKVFHPWVIWCLRKTTSAMAPIYLGNFISPALGLVERLMTYTSHLLTRKCPRPSPGEPWIASGLRWKQDGLRSEDERMRKGLTFHVRRLYRLTGHFRGLISTCFRLYCTVLATPARVCCGESKGQVFSPVEQHEWSTMINRLFAC